MSQSQINLFKENSYNPFGKNIPIKLKQNYQLDHIILEKRKAQNMLKSDIYKLSFNYLYISYNNCMTIKQKDLSTLQNSLSWNKLKITKNILNKVNIKIYDDSCNNSYDNTLRFEELYQDMISLTSKTNIIDVIMYYLSELNLQTNIYKNSMQCMNIFNKNLQQLLLKSCEEISSRLNNLKQGTYSKSENQRHINLIVGIKGIINDKICFEFYEYIVSKTISTYILTYDALSELAFSYNMSEEDMSKLLISIHMKKDLPINLSSNILKLCSHCGLYSISSTEIDKCPYCSEQISILCPKCNFKVASVFEKECNNHTCNFKIYDNYKIAQSLESKYIDYLNSSLGSAKKCLSKIEDVFPTYPNLPSMKSKLSQIIHLSEKCLNKVNFYINNKEYLKALNYINKLDRNNISTECYSKLMDQKCKAECVLKNVKNLLNNIDDLPLDIKIKKYLKIYYLCSDYDGVSTFLSDHLPAPPEKVEITHDQNRIHISIFKSRLSDVSKYHIVEYINDSYNCTFEENANSIDVVDVYRKAIVGVMFKYDVYSCNNEYISFIPKTSYYSVCPPLKILDKRQINDSIRICVSLSKFCKAIRVTKDGHEFKTFPTNGLEQFTIQDHDVKVNVCYTYSLYAVYDTNLNLESQKVKIIHTFQDIPRPVDLKINGNILSFENPSNSEVHIYFSKSKIAKYDFFNDPCEYLIFKCCKVRCNCRLNNLMIGFIYPVIFVKDINTNKTITICGTPIETLDSVKQLLNCELNYVDKDCNLCITGWPESYPPLIVKIVPFESSCATDQINLDSYQDKCFLDKLPISYGQKTKIIICIKYDNGMEDLKELISYDKPIIYYTISRKLFSNKIKLSIFTYETNIKSLPPLKVYSKLNDSICRIIKSTRLHNGKSKIILNSFYSTNDLSVRFQNEKDNDKYLLVGN